MKYSRGFSLYSMFILAVFSMYHTADAHGDQQECKPVFGPCTPQGGGDGICDKKKKCQVFRDVDLSGFSDRDFENFAPHLVKEAKKWQQGKALKASNKKTFFMEMYQKKKYFLSARQVTSILDKANQKINAKSNKWWPSPLVEVTTPLEGQIVLLGDTHGELKDVLWIFQKHGLPSKSAVYLFNGDICDRGSDAVTIWVLLLVYKLSNMAVIHINRGNHEDISMTRNGGFAQELNTKFSGDAEHISGLFHSIFNALPLYTIINNEMFVVHGGLPRVDAAGLAKRNLTQVNRARACPVSPRDTSDEIFVDALWADPQEKNGITIGTYRGDTVTAFGPDVTINFLNAMNLTRVIRSHEPKDTPQWAGLESFHDDKGITVFSASNYYLKQGDVGNRAAVLILTKITGDTQTNIKVTQHYIENDVVFDVAEKKYSKFMKYEGPLQKFLSKKLWGRSFLTSWTKKW